ncbi:hypothetical protein CRYUN_Cryun01aG0074600 [Craigia yunnanensis]
MIIGAWKATFQNPGDEPLSEKRHMKRLTSLPQSRLEMSDDLIQSNTPLSVEWSDEIRGGKAIRLFGIFDKLSYEVQKALAVGSVKCSVSTTYYLCTPTGYDSIGKEATLPCRSTIDFYANPAIMYFFVTLTAFSSTSKPNCFTHYQLSQETLILSSIPGTFGWKEYQRAKPVIIDPGLYSRNKSDVFWVLEKRSVPTTYRLFTGCPSIGGGAFTELGPFCPRGDGRSLRRNSMSWNRASNLLFVESPAGVGWSYSNNSSDYIRGMLPLVTQLDRNQIIFSSTDFRITLAKDMHIFMMKWNEKFPEFKSRELFLTGESYAEDVGVKLDRPAEETMAEATPKALEAIPYLNVLNTINRNNIPSISVIKQSAIAVEFVCIKRISD